MRLEQAVVAYREALEENAFERVPLQWAKTIMNLGIALVRLGEWEGDPARLEQAVAAFHGALQESDPRARAAHLGRDTEQSRTCSREAW